MLFPVLFVVSTLHTECVLVLVSVNNVYFFSPSLSCLVSVSAFVYVIVGKVFVFPIYSYFDCVGVSPFHQLRAYMNHVLI